MPVPTELRVIFHNTTPKKKTLYIYPKYRGGIHYFQKTKKKRLHIYYV